MDSDYVVLCDFDGTISVGDVGEMMLEHFLGRRWRELDERYHDGEFGMEELYRLSFLEIGAGEIDFERFLEGMEIDPAFASFVKACEGSGLPVLILSDGFDFYIDKLLSRTGLSGLPILSNNLVFENGLRRISFPNPHPTCRECANCKQSVVRRVKSRSRVVYIGNGLSDCCAAKDADIVYAKDSLAAHFMEEGLAFEPYRTFAEVAAGLYNKGILKD